MTLTMRETLMKYPKALIRSVFIIINNCYCIPTYVVWMVLLLPLKHIHPYSYYRVEGLFFHWLLAIVSCWSWSAGYDIVELGDDITKCINSKTLIIANHQSTADVPLMMSTFNTKPNVLPNIMWIMDRLFKYTNFGIVSLIHQDFFIASGKDNRNESVLQLRDHILSSYIPRDRLWMVLFPEGGFLRKRRAVSQRFALKNNLPVLEHVTLPRVGAMKAIIDVLGSTSSSNNNSTSKPIMNGNSIPATTSNADKDNAMINTNTSNSVTSAAAPAASTSAFTCKPKVTFEYILDITIAYQNGVPLDLPNIVHGLRSPCQTYFYYRLYPSSEVPRETDSLTKWLYDRFIEKNEILDGFYKTGSFQYASANTPTIVQQDPLRYLILHIFFITSTYVHMQMLSMLYNYYNTYTFTSLT